MQKAKKRERVGRKCWEGLGENASTGREEIREGEEQKTTKEENRKISRNGSVREQMCREERNKMVERDA
jgi:hypothetical protein